MDLPTRAILIAGDHKVYRNGLVIIFADQPDFRIVGEALDGEEVLGIVKQYRPDVLLAAVRLTKKTASMCMFLCTTLFLIDM